MTLPSQFYPRISRSFHILVYMYRFKVIYLAPVTGKHLIVGTSVVTHQYHKKQKGMWKSSQTFDSDSGEKMIMVKHAQVNKDDNIGCC